MKQLLYFLSKTDPDIIAKGPRSAAMQQSSMGMFVLLTGMFAWLSSTFAISTLFNEYDATTGKASITNFHQAAAALIGFIYSIMIMSIDREIVSTGSRWSVIPRILLASIIGVVVAVPIEIKILEDSILKSIDHRNTIENKPLFDAEDQRINVFDEKINSLEQTVQNSRNDAMRWSEIMEQEATGKKLPNRTGKIGKGVHYDEAERNYQLCRARITTDSLNLEKENSKRDSLVVDIKSKTALRSTKASFGFYAMYKELHLMQEDDPTSATTKLSWGICLLFVFIEITPALIKLIRNKSEYDSALEARRRINITAIHKVSNDGMTDIARSDGTEEDVDYVARMKSKISW